MSSENRSEDLIRLTYCSTATFESSEGQGSVEREVARILMESRRNNPKFHIGGVLHYGNGYFFQALEGLRKPVNERYERIVADNRHRKVELLSVSKVNERMFPDWSMKYVAVETRIRDLLARHGIQSFNPYGFDEDLCEELMRCFVEEADEAEALPKAGDRKPVREEDTIRRKPSFLARLFGRT